MKQNPVVILLVIIAMAYAFFIIPKLSGQTQTHTTYEYYSQFYNDLKAGNIAEVTLVNREQAKGKFRAGAKGQFETFDVMIPSDENLAQTLIDVAPEGTKVGTAAAGWSEKLLMVAINIVPIILFMGIIYYFFMRQMRSSGNQALSFGRSGAKMMGDNFPRITFNDVAGMTEVKEELEEVVAFLREPEKFRVLGAKIPRGVLLVGPPGCGKTLLARAVAGEAGVNFFYISGSDFVEMFVGVGASRVRDLFQQAQAAAPAIIFIDELDAVGRLRGAGLGGGHDEREQTLNQLLVQMDGFDPSDDIILLAATNRPDILDPALLRPGRFDRHIVVPTPNVAEREAILGIYIKDKPIAEEVDVKTIAQRTPGFSGADIENLVNEAALLTARRDRDVIGITEFDEAIERVIAGPERKSRVIREEEQRVLAYHEAGHALVGSMLPDYDITYKVTILPRGQALGYTISLPEDDRYLMRRTEILNRMAQALGGRAAEELVIGDITTGASNDLERVSQMARDMVTEYGMSDALGPITYGKKHGPVFLAKELSEERNYSEEIAEQIDAEVRRIVDECYDRAKEILSNSREALDTLVDALLEHETLNREQVEAIIETGALPVEEPEPVQADTTDEPPVGPKIVAEPAPRSVQDMPPHTGLPDPQTP